MSKNQRRILTVLHDIGPAREQLLAAMEDISPSFSVEALSAAAQSADPRERNNVSIVENETQKLINWMEDLAARVLAEGMRLGIVAREKGTAWERLVDLAVITRSTADRLREAKDTRNELAHAYPPQSWAALRDAAITVVDGVDDYMLRLRDWTVQNRILPPAP